MTEIKLTDVSAETHDLVLSALVQAATRIAVLERDAIHAQSVDRDFAAYQAKLREKADQVRILANNMKALQDGGIPVSENIMVTVLGWERDAEGSISENSPAGMLMLLHRHGSTANEPTELEVLLTELGVTFQVN